MIKTKNKIILGSVLTIAFLFTAGAAYASLSFTSDTITGSQADQAIIFGQGYSSLPDTIKGYTGAASGLFTATDQFSPLGVESVSDYAIYTANIGRAAGSYVYGIESDVFSGANGQYMYGMVPFINANGHSVPESRMVDLQAPNLNGGSIVNNIALNIADQTAGTNNWAIKTGLGKVRFGDTLTVGPDESSLPSWMQGYTGADDLFVGSVGIESTASSGLVIATSGGWSQAINADSYTTVTGTDAISMTGYAEAKGAINAPNLIALRAYSPGYSDGGTATNSYGLFVMDQTGATNNWAIRTGTGKVEFGDLVKLDVTGFSSLPVCNAGAEGSIRSINDSNTGTWGATIAGGGSNHVLAYCNGTNWTVR